MGNSTDSRSTTGSEPSRVANGHGGQVFDDTARASTSRNGCCREQTTRSGGHGGCLRSASHCRARQADSAGRTVATVHALRHFGPRENPLIDPSIRRSEQMRRNFSRNRDRLVAMHL